MLNDGTSKWWSTGKHFSCDKSDKKLRAGEMAQWFIVYTALPEELNVVPSTDVRWPTAPGRLTPSDGN